MAQAETRRQALSSRLDVHRQRVETRGVTGWPRGDSGTRFGAGARTDWRTRGTAHLQARYYDRPDLIRHSNRHIYTYYDPYHRLHHRVIWPSYYYPVCYSYGPYWYGHYVWPYYHRKYVFISLGGWWPYDYDYMRYYWYGWHPYLWYGYYPVAQEVAAGSDNYYTYNYYYDQDGSLTSYNTDAPMDPVTQARLQAQLQQQRAVEPAPQTLADTRFEEAVQSFEAGDYAAAAAKFNEARRLSPQDMILPFAYAQALFADGRHDQAADVLRDTLQNVAPDKEGVFFPRGLYANDDVLFAQVEKLVDKADEAENDANLQLLLGYQLLGVGETGYAREPLEQAAQDPRTAAPAAVLLKLLDKMEKEAGSAAQTGGAVQAPQPKAGQPAAAAVPQTPKAEQPTPATVGEMMSTAAQAETTPTNESVPSIPEGEAPVVPPASKPEGPTTEKKSTAPAEEPSGAPTEDVREQSAAAAEAAGWVEQAGLVARPTGWVSGLSRLVGPRAPNFRADIVIFGSILTLALAGVWVEWRFLGRYPA